MGSEMYSKETFSGQRNVHRESSLNKQRDHGSVRGRSTKATPVHVRHFGGQHK